MAHNGEINTIRGNVDRMLAREETMSNPVIDDALDKIYPVVNGAGSDSAMLDNTLEFLVMSGMDLPLAVMVTIPEPWTKDGSISRAKRDLYQYYAIIWSPGMVRPPSCSPTATPWERCWTGTGCAPPGTISLTTVS